MRKALGSPRALAGLGAGLGLLIACIAWFVPYLTRERENVAGVPVPSPFISQAHVVLKPSSEACLSGVAFGTDADTVELTTFSVPRSPLEIVAKAPGYRGTGTVPGGDEPLTALRASIDPPERSVIGTLCIRNQGKRRIDLLGTSDARTAVGRPITEVDGTEITPDLSVRLLSSDTGSVLERLGQLIDRAAAFKPGLFGAPIFLWMVALLFALGLPTAAVYSLVSSFRGSD